MKLLREFGRLGILLLILTSLPFTIPAVASDSPHEAHETTAYSPYLSLDPGQCNRELLAGALAGSGGATLASRSDRKNDKVLDVWGGTAVGVLVGGVIGQWMDSLDQYCIAQALEQAPDSKGITWQGAQPVEYTVTPMETQHKKNRSCRRYMVTALISGQEREARATACRNPDGSWQLAD